MKKIFYLLPVITIAALSAFVVHGIKSDIKTFEHDLRISYYFSGFLECKFPDTLNENFKKIYYDACITKHPNDLSRLIRDLEPMMGKMMNSPLIRMRPFRPQNQLLSQYTNKEYLRLRDYMLSHAKTEFSKAQSNVNFMEANCTSEAIRGYLALAEEVRNQFVRMSVLSEIKSCMYISNAEDQGLIQTLLALAPEKIEDESASVNQLKDYVRDQSLVLSLMPQSMSHAITTMFLPKATETMLTEIDHYFYNDELSQLFYLRRDFEQSLKFTEIAMKFKINKYDIENYNILNYMTLARLGKVYLQLNRAEDSKAVITQLDKENEIYKKLPEVYYIDLSLAELFLQSNDRRPAMAYLETSNKKKYIPDHLFNKWKTELADTGTVKLELDMFRHVNRKSIDSKIFKNEENQIILFKDKLDSTNQSLQ